jgi:N6-adenosine-specific RNA methylase IME4
MTLDEIAALDVQSLTDRGCHLYLWTVTAVLRHSFGIAEAWGFKPKNILTWCKPGLGSGTRFRQNTEHILFATRGKTFPIIRHDVGAWHQWPRRRHSEKPDAFFDLVETVSPGPYLEMFARRQRLGWDTWGNEALNHVNLSVT